MVDGFWKSYQTATRRINSQNNMVAIDNCRRLDICACISDYAGECMSS